ANGTATGTGGISNIENATGGTGGDSLVGNSSSNALLGNAGNDTLLGAPGNDTMNGGANDDVLVWSNGDGSDLMDGATGTDIVQVNGSLTGGDQFLTQVNPADNTRVRFDRTNLGLFNLNIGGAETLIENTGGGDDTLTVDNLTAVTDLTTINLNGQDGNDTFNVKAAATVTINANGGLPTTLTGDTLNYDAQGRIVGGDTTPPDGQITSAGVQNVNFQQLETVNVINGTADLSVTKTDSPDPASPGTNLSYTITLTNNGPGPALNVMLSDSVPANTTFVSLTSPAGWTSTTPPLGGTGAITATNPSVAAGQVSTFTLVVRVNNNPTALTLTNTASVSSTTPDPDLTNNSATAITSLPALFIDDVSVTEGNSGSVNAVFTVGLTAPSSQTVTVDFSTANGTATQPGDYTAVNGTVTFMPGQVTRTITVPVNGDTVPEGNETFFVNLTNPSNAPILDGQGIATIIEDDPGGTLQFSTDAYSVNETGGSVTITVNRTGSTLGTVMVNFATTNGTASAGSDYTA